MVLLPLVIDIKAKSILCIYLGSLSGLCQTSLVYVVLLVTTLTEGHLLPLMPYLNKCLSIFIENAYYNFI